MINERMSKNNKGFSLLELIIVVVILTVMLGAVTYGLGILTGREAHQCANNISTALDKGKNYCMTRSGAVDAYLEISRETDQGYVAKYWAPERPMDSSCTTYELIEEEVLGNKRVRVTFGGVDIGPSPGNSIKIVYNRANGSLKSTNKTIVVSRGRSYEIKFQQLTGKHTMKRR